MNTIIYMSRLLTQGELFMKLKNIIISIVVLLSISGTVVFSNADRNQPDENMVNLQKAVISLKELVDSLDSKLLALEKRVNALEENAK